MIAVLRWTVLGLLLALRLPSLVQPAAADQSLYAYIGLRILVGEAPYVDAWDQKPPGIHLLYALLWWIWPDERVVNVADLAAAVGVCWLLVALGRRIATPWAGWLAAWIFALLANPSMHRLSGVFQRGQCETFIALAVTGALVMATARTRRAAAMTGAGFLLGIAIWLKYNAALFALPIAAAVWLWQPHRSRALGATVRDLAWVTGSATTLGAVGLAWLAWHGALADFWLATFDYNVAYSSSGYTGPGAFAWYLVSMPLRQARHELLWLLGLGGVALGMLAAKARPASIVGALWIGTAILAIAINGRDLPQYFVQATPALAFAGATGLAAAWAADRRLMRVLVVALLVGGLWRIGTERPLFGSVRLADLPGLVDNITFDLAYWRGRIDRRTYLDRFGGRRTQDKYSALDVEELAVFVGAHSAPTDRVLVFGFSPGVYVKAGRQAASRFFWSYPVIIGFAEDHGEYGATGLLEDLRAARPALVALQRRDYEGLDSRSFFMGHAALVGWLTSEYRLVTDAPFDRYDVWQRAPFAAGANQGAGAIAEGNGAPARIASRIKGD